MADRSKPDGMEGERQRGGVEALGPLELVGEGLVRTLAGAIEGLLRLRSSIDRRLERGQRP